ncbi:MAG: biopolymer transporter ExbD [bacterium]|nr:biopolymer transporter ExbD [bacterium]
MDEQEFSQMNVMPLVDVMLVLLTIVLTTSSFIATGHIPVNLPQTGGRAEKPVEAGKMLEINEAGQVFFEGQPQEVAQLEQVLEPVERNLKITLRADQNIRLGRFVEVMDLLKRMQFTRLELVTEVQP